ncbi:hypothetical protein B0H16DRAFT_1556415 [Mycena metata]|uniref:Uncharacterized protein n=1 Tax=Mycena metata TaxID=1033252 RepID=A0AAD7IPL7_9AGAR|nr:hypothetical protein B0H16DRAFT_1556415 [Mycena metata]
MSADVEDGEICERVEPALNRSEALCSPGSDTCVTHTIESVASLWTTQQASVGLREMTPQDLDLAKDIVLDLLGWGVDPEYLVDCGVSAATIHRIFTDLKLRLPQNLGA